MTNPPLPIRVLGLALSGVFLALACVTAAGCGGCGTGDQDGGSDAAGPSDAGGPSDAAPGTDAAADSGTPPPECVIGLISDDATPNVTPLFALLDAMPDVGWDHTPDNTNVRLTESAGMLGAYEVIVWYQHNRLISQAEHDTLETWIQAGGRLLVTGHDSLGDPDDPLLASLVRSAEVGDFLGVSSFTITDGAHPIATGPFGTHATGEMITTPTGDIDGAEADPAAGAVTVAEYTDGHDKIVATEFGSGGLVVYWNGNGANLVYDSPDWAPGETAMREMFQNAIAWMCAP